MDAPLPPSIPRLRISRFSPQSNSQALTPVAGPSHNPSLLHADDDDEDAESTPRMSSTAIPDKQSPRTGLASGLPADTPADRLRALLARVPNSSSSATPHASSSRPPAPPSSSEPDSDFEPPYSHTTAPSIARESLKELFSRALREPGNTPRKDKQRRNSIDASEVESNPRTEERAKYKGKRRSLSDEETEKSKHYEASERSFRSSSAASAFDALRQRLDGSTSAMPSLPSEQFVLDMSMPPPNSSVDTAMPPAAPVDISLETPPYATSTPMRTFQMSAHLHMQSNLLDQDSEMQNALQGIDSYEIVPAPRHRHSSTPSLKQSIGPIPRPPSQGPSPSRPLSWSSHSKSHSLHNMPPVPPTRRSSEDLETSSSRASSSLSGADFKERQDDVKRERLHERERGWNSPLPKSPAHPGRHDPSNRHSWGSPGNGRGSPAHRLMRKGSAASLTSTDDGRSSRTSSVASRGDHDDRKKFVQEERAKEREREWNKPHPKLSRSSSSLSLNKSERIRTNSQPTRPDSAASYLSPNRHSLRRHASSNSLSSSSRPNSPAGSISGLSIDMEVEHEIVHERERNWNSPHPKWNNSLPHRRSLSPLPRSPAGSPPPPTLRKPTTATPRSRHNSTTSTPSLLALGRLAPKEDAARPTSPLHSTPAQNSSSQPARPKSPTGRSSPDKAESSSLAGYKSHFGWSFPQKRTPLPPLELDQDSPQKPPSRPSSRLSISGTPSHIPVRSPRKSLTSSSASTASHSEKKRSHRRSITEFAESVGAIPPRIEVTSDVVDDLPPVPIVNSRDDFSSASSDESIGFTSTPTAKPIPLPPPPEATTTPPSEPPAAVENGHSLQAPDTSSRSESPLASPPPTPPPTTETQPMFSLQTPPRRPHFSTPKAAFETPPPPRGMPDLPGPPSEDEDEDDDHTPIIQSKDIQGNLTAINTPRPPGAWLATPAPSRQPSAREPVKRAGSAPPAEQSSVETDSGLATPPSTLSRANSLPPQTPAPPGGWVNTPAPDASARRKGALKVRFDVESETASDVTVERPSADSSTESKATEDGLPNASWSVASLQNGDASTSSAPPVDSSADAPPTPPSLRARIRQKSPSIRVLDAYGRERVDSPPPSAVHETAPKDAGLPVVSRAVIPVTPRRESRPATSATPRNRSGVRMVDAMGREIEEEPVQEQDSSSSPPLSRSEALSRIRETISTMAQELSDVDRSSDNTVLDTRSYAALEERCRAARLARNKLSKSLQMAQSAEVELKSKYEPLRARLKQSASLPDAPRLSWRLIAWLALLQLLLLAAVYRYSLVQARKIFLTTYFDPFYPELYRYLVKPDTTRYAIPSCPSWSIFTVFSSLQRAGLTGVVADAWTSATCSVAAYLQSLWVDLSYAPGTVAHSWPPT